MKKRQPLSNQKKIILAAEYRQLITLTFLSEVKAERMIEILDLANYDEALDCLIEEVEASEYLKSINGDEQSEPSSTCSQDIQRLLELISANNLSSY